MIVPLADMLNHAGNPNTSWKWDEARDGFLIKSNTEIGIGEEVFDSYGPKNQLSFLLH